MAILSAQQPEASTSKPQTNGIHSSTGSSYLNPADALKHLETYQKRDGLSLHELMDSSVHGGLTCA
jgi:IMP dehydrogenase